jgi:tetratricopeptide (TPR) repeat protein
LPTAYLNRGSCHYDKGEISLAIQDVTEAIEVNPKDDKEMASLLYCFRGLYYRALGLMDLAIADYKTVIQLGGDPKMTERAQEALDEIERGGVGSGSEATQSIQKKYYESSTFYFVYPNDWGNISDSINEILSNNPTLGLDQVAEVAFGIDEEGKRGAFIAVGSNPVFNITSIDQSYDKNQMQSLGYMIERAYIDKQSCVVFKFQNPGLFTKQTKVECLKNGRLYWIEFISVGNKYYTQHEETYNMIMNSLKFK